jgi:ABC-type nitrate/sulfonate/bicarbonate transport system permease component
MTAHTETIAPQIDRPSSTDPLDHPLAHPLTLRLISIAIVLGSWEYAGRVPISPAFPTALETFSAIWEMLLDGTLIRAFSITLYPLVIGLLASIFIGVGIGVAMGLNRFVEWLGAPIFIIAQSAPLAALIPVLTFAYGIGLASKVLTVCIMAMPVIVLNSLNAVRHTPVSLIEMGRSFLGNRWQLIFKVILPAASPVIFAGLRLGCAAGFIGVILAELLITPTGIGDIITYNQAIADYPKMYGAIFSIIVFSILFIDVLEWIEVTLFRPERRGNA